MIKCPGCESEILKEEYNYCPICGALLDYEITESAVEILNALLFNYKISECEDAEKETYKTMIVGSLRAAISALERSAQEVPVQEELVECRNRKNVSIRNEDGITKVTVEGKEIYGIRKLTFAHEAGKIPVATLEVYPKILTVDSCLAFDVKTLFEKR